MGLMGSSKNDILRNAGISAVESTPYVGGVLAYILDKQIPEQVNLRYLSFLESLENDIISINRDIDISRFESPQFYSTFVKVINEIINNHIEEKRASYKNILINTLISGPSWTCNKNDFFFSITSRLSIDAINYLFLIYLNLPQTLYGGTSSFINDILSTFKTQKNYVLTIISELARFNLIRGANLTEFGRQYCNFIFSPIPLHSDKK